jgi:dihydrodipicolinate synthase/N-acetylneuraminate lyase
MKLTGIITAALTPLTQDGEALAEMGIFEKYYRFLLDRRINGLFVCGTTGEGMVLTLPERKAVAERAVRIVAGEVPVLVHVGCNSTVESIEMARHAAAAGASGAAVITPYFYSYDQPAIGRHFRAIANAVPDLPIFLYYLPSYTHNDLSPSLVAELRAECPNITGLKHSDSDQVRLQEYRQVVDDDFTLLSGDDSVALAALSLGADGCVTGKSSTFPEMLVAIYRSFEAGDVKRARMLQSNLNRLLGGLLDIGQGIGLAYFKAALRYRGMDVGGMRAPQRWLTPQEEAVLIEGLERLSMFSSPPGTWLFPDRVPL